VLGVRDGRVRVGTGDGILELEEVQLPTRKRMPARNLLSRDA
jgi:methionyl-tRNA formyltransferase